MKKVKTAGNLVGEMRTKSESRRKILKHFNERATELLTGRFYHHRSRDGPGKEIDDLRNKFEARMSSSIFSRLEYQLIHGFTFNPKELKLMIKAANDEEQAIIKWVKNQTKVLWPKWRKLVKEFKNENQGRKRNGDEERLELKIS